MTFSTFVSGGIFVEFREKINFNTIKSGVKSGFSGLMKER